MRTTLAKMKEANEASKQEKVSLLQRIRRIAQKNEKKEERRAYRPRGYFARKVGIVLFWLGFAFMFLVVLVSATSPEKTTQVSAADIAKEVKLNPATTTTAVQYAENFAKEYFTWVADDKGLKDREQRLAPFLAKGLDKQAGLQVDSLNTNSVYVKSEIKNIEEKGPNKAYVTLKVFHKVEIKKAPAPSAATATPNPAASPAPSSATTPDPAASPAPSTAATPDPAASPAPSATATPAPAASAAQATAKQTAEVSKFFVIPVGYGQNYGIYDLPKFTFIDPKTTLEIDNPATGLSEPESSEKQNVRNFLDTFFGSYAADPRDKLAYLLDDKKHANGLNQTMKFVSVKSANVYRGALPQEYTVLASVIFEDPTTKDRYNTSYRLNIIQKDGRYIVNKLDSQ